MASIFTRILNGELPGRIVWKDEFCFALMTHRPIRPGHVLIIPRQEINHWLDLDPALTARLFEVARSVGRGVQSAFSPTKVGVMIAGLEVPHTHVHLVPIDSLSDLDFSRQDLNASAEDLDRAAAHLRASLRALGYSEVSE